LNNVDRSQHIIDTTNFACHAWMSDTARIVLCSERGDLLLCENSGEYYAFIDRDERQHENRPKVIMSYTRGFILGWSTGLVQAYERYDDPYTGTSSYKRVREMMTQLEHPHQLMSLPLSSMALTSTEDTLYLITENNQLLRASISLDLAAEDTSRFEYVICNFHS
jgi:hypothetical protein